MEPQLEYVLTVQDHFEAAHYLPRHPGKCRRMHGHRWEVVVTIYTWQLPSTITCPDGTGMIIDFGDVKEVIQQFDHGNIKLNALFVNPTAEVIATYILEGVMAILPGPQFYQVQVQLWESPECSVTVTRSSYANEGEQFDANQAIPTVQPVESRDGQEGPGVPEGCRNPSDNGAHGAHGTPTDPLSKHPFDNS